MGKSKSKIIINNYNGGVVNINGCSGLSNPIAVSGFAFLEAEAETAKITLSNGKNVEIPTEVDTFVSIYEGKVLTWDCKILDV